MRKPRQFASDNQSGICPEAFAAFQESNRGHASSYGEDEWTEQACDSIRKVFETDCEVFFVFNGTAANALALAQVCRPYHSVICHEAAHLATDECAAPEFFGSGTKIIPLTGPNGKLFPSIIEPILKLGHGIHAPKPRAVSITQGTELGTVYSVAEIKALSAECRRLGLRLHMDGARLANAIVSLDVKPRKATWEAGVDVLSFGAVKNGGAIGEAVVFFDRALAEEFDYRCKQAGQLASKMRFLAAPWIGLLNKGAWLRHARHANTMAQKLAAALKKYPQVKIAFPVEANAVFVQIPTVVADGLHAQGWHFYWMDAAQSWRLMCSWDTTENDVRHLVADLLVSLRAARR